MRLASLKKRTALVVTAVATAGLLLMGCGSEAPKDKGPAAQGFPVTWSAMIDGKEVKGEVTKAPTKAISMSQATTEMMLALGLEKQMAGTAFLEEPIYEPLADAYKKVPVIAEKWPSYEQFMAAQPDFTTGWGVSFTKKGIPVDKITSNKVAVYVPDSMIDVNADLDTLFKDMLKLGDIFGQREAADKWVKTQKEKLNVIQGKIKDLPTKRVFIYDNDNDQPFTVFSGYTDKVFKLIGVENVMSGKVEGKTWAITSWENVVAANPDYIIVLDYDTSGRNDDSYEMRVKKLQANPQLQNVNAIKNNQFIRVKLSEITPGVRTVDALERLAKDIHGIK